MNSKSHVINYLRVVFRKVNFRYQTVPTCNETHPVHTIVLDLKDPLVFYTPSIRGHKTFLCLESYLLLVHVGRFFLDCFLPFFMRVWAGTDSVLVVTIDKSIWKFKFLMALFSFVVCSMILLASSLYKAWSFFIPWTAFKLTLAWGEILTWPLTSSLKSCLCCFRSLLHLSHCQNH